MNQLNPFYLVALVMLLVVFSVVNLQNVKVERVLIVKDLNEKVKIAKELQSLKKVYNDKVKIKYSLEKILKYSSLKKIDISKTYKKTGVVLKAKAVDLIALNILMGKILNGSFNIDKLKIKRINDKEATLEVGIKW